ncbi:AsmA family protein [Bradyrhizobium sp.]|uniref:AsmA family protein n=1 Tax=Bradyrhizobium sp. TaxID=376 RepID=UPI003C471D1E
MRALKILSGIIAAIVVVAVLLLIIGIPSGFLTSTIQDRVERETGYRLTVAGSTRVGLWPSLNVTMRDVTLTAPKDSDAGSRLSAGSIQADITFASLWSGYPEITELVINHPDISVPLLRERRAIARTTSSPPKASPDNASSAPAIKRVTVNDGRVTFFNTHDGVERRIEGISARATIGADRALSLKGNARAGGHPLTFDVKASMPNPPLERQNIPVELSLDAPGVLRTPLSSKAEARINGTVVMINSIAGSVGDGAFDGWASVDFATKPLVKLDLDFRRLDIATTTSQAAPQGAAAAAWSNDPIDLAGLNYVDAQVRLSAAELNIGSTHFAPVALEASLASGQLKGTISNLGAYGGQAEGSVDIDVSRDTPVYAVRSDLTGVRALPLLSSAASFDKLDGKLSAKIDVRSTGQSQQAIMSNLAGSVVANFQDGAIRGLNVAQMIRSLASSTLSGWQESQEQTTDLTQLSASFRIDKGQAVTADLDLVGPLVKMTGGGTIDLGAQTLALRVEPKLVMTTEGQGRSSDPVAFGIPVAIDGPWAAPRIYPDVAGILDNPDAAYAKLKELGNGLFAPGGPGGGPGSAGNPSSSGQPDTLGSQLGETLGNLIQQGLSASRNRNALPSPSPNDPSAPAQNNPTPPDQSGRPAGDLHRQFFGR